jgi:HD-GYP domain-containing protein (c-di-GMP phosphodiesterase class II)
VGQYAEKLALQMGLSGDDAHLVFLAGRLHDIGKCAIKNEVLLKPGALNKEEFEHMCIHPEVGSSMLASFSLFKECARYVRGHHERWDGKGYPDKLQGEAIPLGARVIAVADAFDAMTTTRPYRKALPLAEARRRLEEGAGSQWDARIISAFLHLLETTPLCQAEPLTLPVTQPEQAKAA